jgi:hypothetical protein
LHPLIDKVATRPVQVTDADFAAAKASGFSEDQLLEPVFRRHRHPGTTKLLFALIRVFSGHPVPDAAKLVFYWPGFYGARAKKFLLAGRQGLEP